MAEKTPALPITQPVSVWNKPLKGDGKKLFSSLIKAIGHSVTGNWLDLASDVSDAASAIGVEPKPGERAWLLVHRSLQQAMYNLVAENTNSLADGTPEKPQELSDHLDASFEQNIVTLDTRFFDSPGDLPILEAVKVLFKRWLTGFGMEDARAETVVNRLPSYFIFALNHEWRENTKVYAPLKEAIDTPFTKASEKEQAWSLYYALLQKQIEEGIFDETFSLSQVYVPLRAYYEKKKPNSKREDELDPTGLRETNVQRVAVPLQETLDAWISKADKQDAVRVLSGDPGSGKSSFAKMYAAHLTTNSSVKVLFVPLHLFDPEGSLEESVANFVRASQLLPYNPSDAETGEKRLVLIFDGLDELAMQGKVGESIAKDFVKGVVDRLSRRNYPSLRLQVLISGRTVVVQNCSKEFNEGGKILHLLPYYMTEEQRKPYRDEQHLLEEDQRSTWWQRYGMATGNDYDGLPQELQREDLDDITAQPLLNYLVALSLKRGKLDFSKPVNLNAVYDDLISAVYERGYAGKPHKTVSNIEKKNFIRLLEDIGAAAWHGNGRTTTIKQIEDHCAVNGKVPNLDVFEEGAKSGITRLLTAFYFRQHGRDTENEATFEFTHKSFGEYLTIRRIVRALGALYKKLKDYEDDPDNGCDEKQALVEWVTLCGPTEMTNDLFKLLCNEIILLDDGIADQWQTMLVGLINYLLRHGIPMEKFSSLGSFQEQTRQSRNAEETLLASLNACARITKALSNIKWPTINSAGDWITQLSGQGRRYPDCLSLQCLSYLNLQNQGLALMNLYSANMYASDLSNASLYCTVMNDANLSEANLSEAICFRIIFEQTDLSHAMLSNADLTLAYCRDANMYHARMDGADFLGTDLRAVNLRGADLTNASMNGAQCDNAHLEGAILEGVKGLDNDTRKKLGLPPDSR